MQRHCVVYFKSSKNLHAQLKPIYVTIVCMCVCISVNHSLKSVQMRHYKNKIKKQFFFLTNFLQNYNKFIHNILADGKLDLQNLASMANVAGQLTIPSSAALLCGQDGQVYFPSMFVVLNLKTI